jgi:oligopeptide transport system substrate-binding protein
VACASALTLASCGGDRSTGTRGDILLIGNGTEPEGLDPHVVTGIPEHHVLLTLFEGLVRMDPKDLSPIPGVAERWEASEDALTYTFHLRQDAKWSDGSPLTSKDFQYAWRRMLTPSLGAEYAYMLYVMKNARAYNEGTLTDFAQVGCEFPDERTVVVHLECPTPYFLQLHGHYSWFPVQQKNVESTGAMDDRASRWTRPGSLVGNGPYVLSRWTPNSVIEVRPNTHYWDAANVKNAGVNFYPVNKELTEERMFRAGELHITENAPPSMVPDYRENSPELIRTDPWIGAYFYRVNTNRAAFKDKRVRQALAMSIDREAICTKIMQAGEIPADFLTPPNIAGYTAEARIPYDPARAKQLLAEAGYPNGQGFPTIDILYNTLERHQMVAEAIQQMWKTALGINVTLTNQEWKVYLNSTSNEQMAFDLARAGWIGDVVDAMNFLECFTTGNGNNRTGWSNAEYDRLLAEAMTKNDRDERNALYQQAEAILVDEVPILPIYHYTRTFLIQKNVRGFEGNVLGYYVYHQVWLDRGTGGE